MSWMSEDAAASCDVNYAEKEIRLEFIVAKAISLTSSNLDQYILHP